MRNPVDGRLLQRAVFCQVIFNNQEYGGVKRLFQRTHKVDNVGAGIDPSPDFALVAQGCNAHGRMVEHPDDILSALREATDQVRRGRAAVLDVKVK